ncbi:hypothetical protein [Prevotella koreensis]
MIIYDKDKNILLDAPLTDEAYHEEEMMKSDFVKLSWNDVTKQILPAGSSIVPFNNGIRYFLLEPYEPTRNDELAFKYEPEFHHPKMMLSKIPFLFSTQNVINESVKQLEWEYNGFITTLLQYVVDAINDVFGFPADEEKFTYTIVGQIDNTVTVSFSATDILSALSQIASSCQKNNCEWHLSWEHRCLYFGQISINLGENVPVLKVGENVGASSVSLSSEGYYNVFYPQGATRNMSMRAASGENVSTGIRLGLDKSKYPDGVIDVRKDKNEPKFVLGLMYNDVYPHIDLYAYDIRKRTRYLLDETTKEKIIEKQDGDTIIYKQYTVWYMRLAYPTYDNNGNVIKWTDYKLDKEKQVIDGYKAMITFKANTHIDANGNVDALSSSLCGQPQSGDGFEINYHDEESHEIPPESPGDSGVYVKKGDYEIIFVKQGENNLIVPSNEDVGLIPRGEESPSLKCNIVVLYNIAMGENEVKAAQEELELVAMKEIGRRNSDLNNYTTNSYPNVFEKKNPRLYIGQKILYNDGKGYEFQTRVLKLVTKLDFDFIQEITIGNQQIKGSISQLKEDVKTIMSGNFAGAGLNATQVNNIVQNYTEPRFLSKLLNDIAQGVITFAKGILFGKGNKGIDAEGNATLGNINADDITADSVTSKGYTGSDILSDKGFKMWVDKDGRSHVITDFFTARVKSFFASLEVKKMEHSRGNRIESPAGNTISRVDAYRLRDSFEDPHSEYIKINDRFRAKTYWHKMIHRAGRFFGVVEKDNHPVVFYRCYFTAEDEEKGITNDWRVGDQAFCETFNLRKFKSDGTAYGVTNKRYWRLVIGTGYEMIDGVEHGYIDLCNKPAWKIEEKGKTYHCIGYEDIPDIGIPAAGDDVAAFGSQTHPDTRGGALQYITCGESETSGIPCTRMFAGINGFDLSRHLIKESSPKREMVRADKFEILSAAGTGEYSSITCFRGDWVRGRLYGHYDVVQHFGSSWLCIVPKGTTTTEEPSKASVAWTPFAQRGGNPPAIISDLSSVVMITDSRGAAMSAEVTMPERFSVVVDGSAVPVALWNKARCFVKYRNITARLDGTFEAPQQSQSGFCVNKLQANENDVSIFWVAMLFAGQSPVENPTDIVLHAEFTYKGETMTAEKSIPVIEQRTPASVLAEYSVTGEDNTWHSTFENGDIFAHYSYDGGNTWTPKIRIVGKSLEFKTAIRHFSTWAEYVSWQPTQILIDDFSLIVDENEQGAVSSTVVKYSGVNPRVVSVAPVEDNYLTKYDGHLWSSNGADNKWSDMGKIQGENGDNGMSFVLSPASVIFEQNENTLAIDTSAFKAQVIGMSGSRRLSVGSEYRVSIHDAVHCEASVTGNEVRITSIGKDANENYYSVGKVDVKVMVGSQPIILTLNWAANLLGTWKQTVKSDVMKMVSEKTVTTYDENGNLVTIPFGSVFEQASGHMILTVQGLYGTTGISVTDGTIDLSGKKIIVRNGDAPTAIFEDGKIKANLIDAEKIWADYIAGGNATFTGKVEAKAGYIGGFEIKDGALQAKTMFQRLNLSKDGIVFHSDQPAFNSYVDIGPQNIVMGIGFEDYPQVDCVGIQLKVPVSAYGKTGTAIAAVKGCYEGFRRRCVNAHESMEVGSETGVVRSYANNIILTLPTGIDDGQELIVIPVKSCKVRCIGNAKIVSGNGRREQQVDVTTRTIFIYDKESNLWDRMRFSE